MINLPYRYSGEVNESQISFMAYCNKPTTLPITL